MLSFYLHESVNISDDAQLITFVSITEKEIVGKIPLVLEKKYQSKLLEAQ